MAIENKALLNAIRQQTNELAPARLNLAGELVPMPWDIQMMLEGRIFVAGSGIEENGVAGTADLDDTTPVFGLVSPAGGKVILPLWFKIYYDTEAAAAPEHFHLAYVQADKSAFAAGTEMTSISALGGDNPPTAQAHFLYTLSSVTAITAAQNVTLTSREHLLDNFVSVEAATGKDVERINESNMELQWKPPFPLGLYGGASLLWYGIDATARWNVACAWMELPSDVYLHYTG